jgi:hypothetical protein
MKPMCSRIACVDQGILLHHQASDERLLII